MKFKAIYALFNAVLLISFLAIFLMPRFVLGVDYFSLFWKRNWIVAVVFVLTLGALNVYFFLNWGLFRYLEREDWPGLISYLEDRILARGMARPMYVRMILNAYLIMSNTEGILALESYLKKKRPGLVAQFSLQFGVPYLLMKEPSVSEAFFAALLADTKVAMPDWVKWNHAFSLVQQHKSESASEELLRLADAAKDPLVQMLSLYLLDVYARQDQRIEDRVKALRHVLTQRLTQAEMNRRIQKSGDNMEVVILSKIVQDARDWLYAAHDAGLQAASAE